MAQATFPTTDAPDPSPVALRASEVIGEYYRHLCASPGEGRPVALMPVAGNVAELLRALGFAVSFAPANASQCALRGASASFIQAAEEQGYSLDVCSLVKCDLGLLETGGPSPMGVLPRPDLLVCTHAGCLTFIKWFEELAARTGAPLFVLDVPSVRSDAPEVLDLDRRYLKRQLDELVTLAERVVGRSMNEAELHSTLERAATAEETFARIADLAATKPAPLDGLREGLACTFPLLTMRGTSEAVAFYRWLLAETQRRARLGSNGGREQLRLVLDGFPPWTHLEHFASELERWGARVVSTTYARVSGAFDLGLRHRPEAPLDSLAECARAGVNNLRVASKLSALREEARRVEADGIVLHSVKSCRASSVGQALLRMKLESEAPVPAVFLESDVADPRYYGSAQVRTRLDAFFERLRRVQSS